MKINNKYKKSWRKYHIHSTALFLILTLISCKKFVGIDPPKTQLIRSTVFDNDASANAAQLAIYAQIANGDSYYISLLAGLSADEFTNNPYINISLWMEYYSLIYQANAVIEGLQGSNGVSTDVKKQLTGEAKFIRAYWYFYLTNLFGDVPLITSTNYKNNATASRTPQTTIYQQIVNDLKDAQTLLNDTYVGTDGITSTASTERIRPTKLVAAAMLARIYLYTHDWVNAEAEATLLINKTSNYSLNSNLNEVFLKNNSKETIFQVMSNYNTYEGAIFILHGQPDGGFKIATLSAQLLNAFEPGDLRRANWVDSASDGVQVYYYPYKYKNETGSSPATEYPMMLRLAEQYLIRAEARAHLGNITGINSAATDLNAIRNRAGLPPTLAVTQSDMLTAIRHERQVELFTEWGNRWLDLKRTGMVDIFMSTESPLKGGVWNINQQLYPIPQNDRNSDPNLTQNIGY
jgi:hypothetical protein